MDRDCPELALESNLASRSLHPKLLTHVLSAVEKRKKLSRGNLNYVQLRKKLTVFRTEVFSGQTAGDPGSPHKKRLTAIGPCFRHRELRPSCKPHQLDGEECPMDDLPAIHRDATRQRTSSALIDSSRFLQPSPIPVHTHRLAQRGRDTSRPSFLGDALYQEFLQSSKHPQPSAPHPGRPKLE